MESESKTTRTRTTKTTKSTMAATTTDPPSPTSPTVAPTPCSWKDVRPGDKICVRDPDDKLYYPCTVLRKENAKAVVDVDVDVDVDVEDGEETNSSDKDSHNDSHGRFKVQYENGAIQVTDLTTAPFRWQGDGDYGENGDDEDEGNGGNDEDYSNSEAEDEEEDLDLDEDYDDDDKDDVDEPKRATRRTPVRTAKNKAPPVIELDDSDNEDDDEGKDKYQSQSNATTDRQRRRATRRSSIRVVAQEPGSPIEIDCSVDDENGDSGQKGSASETKNARDDHDADADAGHCKPKKNGVKKEAKIDDDDDDDDDTAGSESEPGVPVPETKSGGKETSKNESKDTAIPQSQPRLATEERVAKKRKKAPTTQSSPSTNTKSDDNSEDGDVGATCTDDGGDGEEQLSCSPKKKKVKVEKVVKKEGKATKKVKSEPVVKEEGKAKKKVKTEQVVKEGGKVEPKTEPNEKTASKPRAKKTSSKRMAEYRARKATQAASKDPADATDKPKRLTVKDVKNSLEAKEISKEDALLSLLVAHSMGGVQAVTFERLFTELGYRPKNKAVEKAWKEVRDDGLVEESKESRKQKGRYYRLTQKGIDRAAPEDYMEWVAEASSQENAAASNAELHELIKGNAPNDYGAVIFEILLEAKDKEVAMTPRELADECGVNKDSHGFFYGFKWLKDQGYAVGDPLTSSKARSKTFLLSDKCFVNA